MRTGTLAWPAPRSIGAYVDGVIALAAAAAGAFVALNHPLSPSVAAAAFVLACGAAYRGGNRWLVALPALLPVFSFAPWTGWLTFEEFDLVVLAVAAGGYLRRAIRPAPAVRSGPAGFVRLAAALVAVSTVVSMKLGFTDAGGFEFGWYQGYHEAMNSVRIAKGPLWAVLLWPLAADALRVEPVVAARRLGHGLALGLLTASLAVLWERLAFPSLLDFSSDYRTTALFWEMHVGGAALDGFLALCVPFALMSLVESRRPASMAVAGATMLLGTYACLTTFSRGVYVAVPIGLAVRAAAVLASADRAPRASRRETAWALVFGVGFTAACATMFPSSGYRGALALVIAFAALLASAAVPARLPAADRVGGLALGAALSAVGWAAGAVWRKGPYFVDAAVVLLGAAAWSLVGRVDRPGASRWPVWALLAAAVWAPLAAAQVAAYWGGEAAAAAALPVVAGLLCLLVLATVTGPLWPSAPRWQAGVVAAMGGMVCVVAVFAGGAYISNRFSTSSADLETRVEHWRDGLSLLRTPTDWWLGRGLGRYPGAAYIASLSNEHPGDYRRLAGTDGPRLVLSAGRQALGFGEVLRISQRVAAPGVAPRVELEVRVKQTLSLHVEVCEKHLLYNAGCQMGALQVDGKNSGWQPKVLRLDGTPVSPGAVIAPRQLVFSVGLGTPGTIAEIRRIRLIGDRGDDLLANGDFTQGLAHWFFSSDRYHLPWHIKNVALNVLLDQGIVGVSLMSTLLLAALWRLIFGGARRHCLAPAVAAALCGFVVVGLFDSLLDVPRVAFAYHLLVFTGLSLPAAHPNSSGRARTQVEA